ncbi:hypothetical protein GQ53DRAFT_847782 [Thozetella sp. PMI_491]|nr:hypothetical protein GQ53DRAFT_847782 [Thozetella sp. PMI_491]
MVASLALESFAVLFPHAASFSMMKACAGSATVLPLVQHQLSAAFKRRSKPTVLLCVLAVLLSIIYGITQFFSVLLISDTGLRSVRGIARLVNTTYGTTGAMNFTQLSDDVKWSRAPALYPAFAEYSEPAFVADDVMDTGVSLRAFLPFRDSASRQTIQSYAGTITVLDARVTCQRPLFVTESSVTYQTQGYISIKGAVLPSRSTPRQGAPAAYHKASSSVNINGTAPFMCVAPTNSGIGSDWGLSICQLPTGALISQFIDLSQWEEMVGSYNTKAFGVGYLVFNVTQGGILEWDEAFQAANKSSTNALSPTYSGRGEWLDFSFPNTSVILSATLCYAPWSQANMPVQISSTHNRTESVPTFNTETLAYNYDFLRTQYGQRGGTPAQRGILQMQNQSWTATADQLPSLYLRTGSQFGSGANVSAMMGGYLFDEPSSGVFADMFFPLNNYRWLVQEILQSGGSVAFVLQSLITLSSSMTYYDNLDFFDKTAEVSQVYFVQANVPVSLSGICTVFVTLALHLVIVAIVVYFFLARTKHSKLGSTWAALAQGSHGRAKVYLEDADLADDGAIEKSMKKAGQESVRIGTTMIDGKVGVSIQEEDPPGSPS